MPKILTFAVDPVEKVDKNSRQEGSSFSFILVFMKLDSVPTNRITKRFSPAHSFPTILANSRVSQITLCPELPRTTLAVTEYVQYSIASSHL